MSKKLPITRTVIYLRKSRKDRDNDAIEETLRRHEEQLLSYAKKQNLDIAAIKKEVVTGDSIAGRPRMQELLEEVEDGLYHAVLVMDVDRLGRGDMIDQGIIANTFKKAGVRILTPDKEYDLENEYDEDFFDLSAFFARKELRMIKRRLQRGKMKSIEEGNYIGTYAPFGYEKHAKTLIINEKERPVVVLIFDLYVNQGMGDTKIAKHLESLCIPNKNGTEHWDRTTIRRIIRNPLYIGKITWDRREYTYAPDGKKASRFLPPEEWKVFPGKHPPIIPEDLFNKAQKISNDRYVPHLHNKRQLRNPLSYIIKCGACGHTMTMRSSKGKSDSLRCYRHCGGVSGSYISIVEEKLIDQLRDSLSDLQSRFDYQGQTRDVDEECRLLESALANTYLEIGRLEKQKVKQYELLEQGLYDSETFRIRCKAITEDITAANRKRDEIEGKIEKCYENKEIIKQSLPKILDAKHLIETYYWQLSPIEKNDFLKSILEEVIYFKEKGAEQKDFILDIMLKFQRFNRGGMFVRSMECVQQQPSS